MISLTWMDIIIITAWFFPIFLAFYYYLREIDLKHERYAFYLLKQINKLEKDVNDNYQKKPFDFASEYKKHKGHGVLK